MLNRINRNKINILGLYALCIGIYIFLYNIRWQFFLSVINTERAYLWAFNFIASAGVALVFFSSYSYKEQIKNKAIFTLGWLPFLAVIPLIISSVKAGTGMGMMIVEIAILVCPLVLLLPEPDEQTVKKVFPAILVVLNILLVLVVFGALIDKLFDHAAIKWLASFMTCDRFTEFAAAKSKETRRYFSIIGHPLVTSAFANTVYVLNHFSHKFRIKYTIPDFVEMIFVGIIMIATEGRAGFGVFVLITLLIFYKKIYLLAGAAIVAAAAFFLGFFDKILARFNASTIDSHRMEHMLQLFSNENYPLRFFTGYGSLDVANGDFYYQFHSAFEQPIIIFSFKYGLVAAFLLVVIPFIFVSVKLIQKKQYAMLIMWMLLFAQENAMPWLSYGYDEPLRFYFATMMLLALSSFTSKDEFKFGKLSIFNAKK